MVCRLKSIWTAFSKSEYRTVQAAVMTSAVIVMMFVFSFFTDANGGNTTVTKYAIQINDYEKFDVSTSSIACELMSHLGGGPVIENVHVIWKPTQAGWSCTDIEGNLIKGQWIYDNGSFFYINAAGIMEADEFRMIDGIWYHLNRSGAVDCDRFYVSGKEYYADPGGALYNETWICEESGWYYAGDLGEIAKAQVTPDGYYVDETGLFVNGDPESSYQTFKYTNGYSRQLYLNTGTADIIWSYLKKREWTDTAIAGVLGNFQQESGIQPSCHEIAGDGYGLGQWSFERRDSLESFAKKTGRPVENIYVQLEFMLSEPGESAFVKKYSKTEYKNPSEAAVSWGLNWERYRLSDQSMSRVRIPYAEAYYTHYVDGADFLVSNTKYSEKTGKKNNKHSDTTKETPNTGSAAPVQPEQHKENTKSYIEESSENTTDDQTSLYSESRTKDQTENEEETTKQEPAKEQGKVTRVTHNLAPGAIVDSGPGVNLDKSKSSQNESMGAEKELSENAEVTSEKKEIPETACAEDEPREYGPGSGL